MTWLVLTLVLALAFANGANDNFKGVATIYGSGTASYRVSLAWATVTTLAGSLLALRLASGLIRTFSGTGLVPKAVAGSPHFLAAVAIAATVTVLLATRLGLPVSTTHALTGALVGAGAVAGAVQLAKLERSFLHFASAGAVSFARGLNDTPKMVALILAATVAGRSVGLLAVAAVIAIGGLLFARRVAETVSHRITTISPGQGFIANLTSAALVIGASGYGLPVSTTHVTSGALFGIGAVNRTARWKTVGSIFAAWLITLPLGAALGAAGYVILR